MTEDQETTPPEGQALTDEPIPDAGAEGGASARAREWLSQLESMIHGIATQAAPVARQVGAKAAELTAAAAAKAGPVAHRAADMTTDVGQRLADRAQSVASELRSTPEPAAPAEGAVDVAPDDDAAHPG